MRALLVSNYTSVDFLRLQDVPSPSVARDYVRVWVNWKGFLRLSLVTCPVALYPRHLRV